MKQILVFALLFSLAASKIAIDHCKTEKNNKCLECERGWGVNELGQCSRCSDNCEECGQDFRVCTECHPHWFVDQYDTCRECTNGCLFCQSADTCEACQDGFYRVDLEEGGSRCDKCNSYCATCSSAEKCDTCKAPNCATCDVYTDNNCQKCKSHFYLSNGVCEECSPQCKECILKPYICTK